MSSFLDYVRDISDGATNASIAKKIDIDRATVGRWEGTPPSIDHIRAIARAYGRPLLEVAVKGGLLTADEVRMTSAPVALPDVTNAALLRELQRRLSADVSDPSGSLSEGEEDPDPDDYSLAAGTVARPDDHPAD